MFTEISWSQKTSPLNLQNIYKRIIDSPVQKDTGWTATFFILFLLQ